MIEHKNAWLRALDEALVSAHLGFASVSDDYDTAKRKLGELIDWHVAVATDPAVNGGWQLVPSEPTQEMAQVGANSTGDNLNGRPVWKQTVDVQAAHIYQAMLAAAPKLHVTAENTSQERVKKQAETEHEPVV